MRRFEKTTGNEKAMGVKSAVKRSIEELRGDVGVKESSREPKIEGIGQC